MKLYHQLGKAFGLTLALQIGMTQAMTHYKQIAIAYRLNTIAHNTHCSGSSFHKNYLKLFVPVNREIESTLFSTLHKNCLPLIKRRHFK